MTGNHLVRNISGLLLLLLVIVLTARHLLRLQAGSGLLAEHSRLKLREKLKTVVLPPPPCCPAYLVAGGLVELSAGEADVESPAVLGVGVTVVVTEPETRVEYGAVVSCAIKT